MTTNTSAVSFREDLPQSDEEIEAAFEEMGYGICVTDLCFAPASEIAAFTTARAQWSDPGLLVEATPDLLHVEKAQAYRGQPRRDVVMIRFGEHCAIYGCDR